MTGHVTPEYLKRQLALDPRTSAARIIKLRSRQLGIATVGRKGNSLSNQSPHAVAGARQAIESIRSQFWTLPLDELNKQLAEIELRPYPELANVVDQLRQAAAVRAEFPKLAQRLNGDLTLFHCIKQSVTMPPRDVAGMKESIMRALLNGDNVKSYKSSAKIIKTEFPQIYALQPEWFDDILNAKQVRKETLAVSQTGSPSVPHWVIVILFILLMRGCVSLMR